MTAERSNNVDIYTKVLNELITSSLARWRHDESGTQELAIDTQILDIQLSIAKRAGCGFEIVLRNDILQDGDIPGLTKLGRKYLTQENRSFRIKTPTGDESWKTHSRRLFLSANKDSISLSSEKRLEGRFNRDDVVSIKVRDT